MANRVIVWVRAVFRWLTSEFRLVWLALLVVVPALVVAYLTGASEAQYRIIGLILQLLGLGTVVNGIVETRRLFNHPSIPQSLHEKASRFPRWPRDVVITVGDVAAVLEGGSVVARGYTWNKVDPAAPSETQVAALTQNVEHLKQQLDQMQNGMDDERRKHTESLRQEQQLREDGDKNLGKFLEAAETGGLDTSLMGVFWLAVGLFLSTLSPEFAQWAK